MDQAREASEQVLPEAGENTLLQEKGNTEETDADEEDEIRPENYPNQRMYQAACNLDDIRRGYILFANPRIKKQERSRYEFILTDGGPLAARYLTADGDFLCAQAVKEHFPDLPIPVKPEDEQQETRLGKLIRSLAQHDPDLALEVWLWCIHQFYPYREHSNEKDYLLEEVLERLDDLPEDFLEHLVNRLAEQEPLRKLIVTGCDASVDALRTLCGLELRRDRAPAAQTLLRDFLAEDQTTGAQICEFAEGLLWDCRDDDGLEQMEQFQMFLLPILSDVRKSVVQRSLKKWTRTAARYIEEMERTCRKYAYTRRYAWRADCKSGSEYGVDPLDYETREAYDEAIQEARYGWREYYSDEKDEFGIDPQDFETEDDFSAALRKERERRWTLEAEERRRQSEEAAAQRRKEREEQQARNQKIKNAWEDPRNESDQTVYTLCGVQFQDAGLVYHYRTEDTSLRIGDLVLVPVGQENRESPARIVSVGQYLRKAAPYSVDQAKFILKRIKPADA